MLTHTTMEGVMTKLSDKKWQSEVSRNAKTRAQIHVETGNTELIAKAMSDLPVLEALEFLFKLADKHRKENKFKKAATILEAVELIDRKNKEGLDIGILIEKQGKKDEKDTVYIRQLTPKEVFE